MSKKKLAVIGAGIAGINCALKLTGLYELTLFEAKSKPGGRLMSFYSPEFLETLDNGQHLAIGAYDEFFKMLKILGTDEKFYKIKGICFPYHTKNSNFILDTTILPGKLGMFAGIMLCGGLNMPDKISFFKLVAAIKFGKVDSVGKTVENILKSYGQTERIIKIFWEPLTLATLNNNIYNAPADLLIAVLQKAFFADSAKSALLLPSIPFVEYFKNFEQFLSSRGGKMRMKSKVEHIHIVPDGSFDLVLRSGNVEHFDMVISALPPYAALSLLDDNVKAMKYFKNISTFHYSPIVSIYFKTDKELEKYEMSAFADFKTQWIFSRNKFVEKSCLQAGFSYTATISAADEMLKLPNDEIFSMFESELRQVYKTTNTFKILAFKVIVDKRATVNINSQNYQLRPNVVSPINNLFLAGDWVDTGLPATMEGAALSAALIESYLKRKYSE